MLSIWDIRVEERLEGTVVLSDAVWMSYPSLGFSARSVLSVGSVSKKSP